MSSAFVLPVSWSLLVVPCIEWMSLAAVTMAIGSGAAEVKDAATV